MIRESVAILIIGMLLVAVCLRSRHFGYALACLPVFFIPVTHLAIRGILYLTAGQFFGVRREIATAFAVLLALAASCAFVILFSFQIKSARSRALYRVVMLIYTVLLGWVYIYTAISSLLA